MPDRFRPQKKTFRTLDLFQPLASKLLSVQGSFRFYKVVFDSPSVNGHLKSIFRFPHSLFRPPIFKAPQDPVRTMKSFVLSQALSFLRKCCSRSRNIPPGVGPEPPWHFTRSRSRQNTQVRLRKTSSLSVFSKPESRTLCDMHWNMHQSSVKCET